MPTMPKKTMLLLMLLAVAGPSRAADSAGPGFNDRAEAYMAVAVKNDHFIGSVLVAKDGVPVLNRSYGMANYEWSVPNSPDTVYRIGSLAKQFTAMLIMQLQERGALSVSDGICKYLTPCPEDWHPITLRHLLTHTSGIPSYTRLPDWDERISRLPQTREGLVANFRDLPLEFPPGEKFRYNNSGYYLLGMVIERVSNQAYADVLQANILTPLGMTQTGYDRQRPLLPKRAAGYDWSGNGFVNTADINADLAYAAGALYSTTGDLLRWDQALRGTQLVSRKSLDEIFSPVREGYGYGWRMDAPFGHAQASHGGSIHGFSAYLSRFPDDRLTVIVLSNNADTSATKVARDLAAIAFGQPVTMPAPQLIDVLWSAIQDQGVAAAVAHYQAVRKQGTDKEAGEGVLNNLGYDLLANERRGDAIAIFKLAAETFPQSANAHDSLGEAYLGNGQRDLAMRHYETSLALDPKNAHAARVLADLKAAPAPGN